MRNEKKLNMMKFKSIIKSIKLAVKSSFLIFFRSKKKHKASTLNILNSSKYMKRKRKKASSA